MGEGWKEAVLLAHQQCRRRHQPRGATFAVGREKCRGRYYRPRGLGSGGGCGEARWPAERQPVSQTRIMHPARKAEGHSWIQDQSFPISPGEEKVFGSSLALRGLREPVGGIQSPGRRAGNMAKHPSPFPPSSQESSGSLRPRLGLGLPGPRARQQRRLLASVGNFTQRHPFPSSGNWRST